MRTYDIATARTNIAQAIEAARANLAQLEASQALIDDKGDDVVVLLDVLQTFGKVKKPNETPTVSLEGLTNDADVILRIVRTASAPVRPKDIFAAASAGGRPVSKDNITATLARLAGAKQIRRMSHGLYWKADGRSKPTNQSPRALSKSLQDLVLKTLTKDPIKMTDLRPKIEAAQFPFSSANHTAAISRAITKLGKKVKHHGSIGPHHAYSLRS